MVAYYILNPLFWVFYHLPVSALRALGKFFAFLTWHLSSERRKVAIKNAEIIGVKDPIKTARESFDYTFVAYLESFYAPRFNQQLVDKYVTVKGMENFESLGEHKSDFLLMGGHFGAWSMSSVILRDVLHVKILTVGRSNKNKGLDRLYYEQRTHRDVIYIGHRGTIEKLPQYMKEGYHPGIFNDHTATDRDCMYLNFFGLKVPVIVGFPAFAARKNIPFLPFFIVAKGGNYEVILYPPIYPDKELKPKERIIKLANDMNKVYEDIISKYPEQWYLIHKRFKRVEEEDGTISNRIYR